MKKIRWIIFLQLLISSFLGCSTLRPEMHSGDYDLVLIPFKENDWQAIKYNQMTGESWFAKDCKWTKIVDNDPLPDSFYRIQIVKSGDKWQALKIDTVSGKSWIFHKNHWKYIND